MMALGIVMALMLTGAQDGAAQPPAEAAAQAPAAAVRGHSVAHAGEGVTVHVPTTARYLGAERFTLYGVADAEIHVFAETDAAGGLRRLYWIQFESYLPSRPELAYNYAEGNRRLDWGGVATWVRAGPVRTDGPMRPGSDRESVYRILARAGVGIPEEAMNVRLVQMLDDPQGTGRGRRELMLIYSEDLAPTGRRVADLTSEGRPNERWTPMEGPLVERATTAFRVERR